MSKRTQPGDPGSQDRKPNRSEEASAAVRGSSSVRSWRLAAGVAIVLLGASWLGVRAFRAHEARNAVANLTPVAPLVSAEPPERRQALEVADRLLQDYPDRPEALYVRGILLSRYGFNDEAVKTWQACLALFPDLAPVYERLGIDAFHRGENDRAVEMLSKAARLDPDSSVAGLYLGEALNSLGRMDEAVPVLEQFLRTSPRSAEAYFQLGQAYLYLQAFEQARDSHFAALREDPQYAQACYGLAVAYGRLGDADKSQQYREQYAKMIDQSRMVEHRRVRQGHDDAELQESLARAYITAATIYQDDGRLAEAEEFRNRAQAISRRIEPPNVSRQGGADSPAAPSPSGR